MPFPVGNDTKLQRMDIITVVGLKGAVNKVGAAVRARRAPEHGDRPADAVGSA